ncbi:hypothetical protein KC678_02265, partial [Candidatus Dojkabacteria bacterium]|nr:hypothetical protein [Candidatus Dojkabacteria bacterium]
MSDQIIETTTDLDSTELLCAELLNADYNAKFSELAEKLPSEYAVIITNWIESPIFDLSNPVAYAATFSALNHAIESDNPIQLENVMKTLFAMDEPSDELLDSFKEGHREVYRELGKKIAAEIASGKRSELFLHSCMYGGKSSLATYIIMELEEKYDYTKTVLITGELGDTKTRPRLLREKNEEDSDYDWNAHRIFSGVDPKYPANIDHIKRIIEDEKG